MTKVAELSVLVFCLSAATFGATMPDFSGDYAARQKKNLKPIAAVVLRVVQSESSIEVTHLGGAKPVPNRFPLDGSEADYITETGARGKCKAQFKNDTLVLESLVASPPDTQGRSVRFHTIEQWRLSTDTKILTIKTEIKSPDIPPEIFSAAFPNNPRTETYERSTPVAPTSAESRKLMQTGSRFFLKQQYKEAIGPYQQALDLEKKDRNLDQTMWRVLIDNLGMAYGITGDLAHAESTFRYGLSQDATYPMFFYNMACVYGERGDLDNTIEYLQKAFSYKANLITGEKMPDPQSDDSFQRFRENPKFRALMESLNSPTVR